MAYEPKGKIGNGCIRCGDCLHWHTKAKSEIRRRHPMARIDGKPTLVRRHVYEEARGELLPEKYLTPQCGDPYCIDPDHQRVMSKAQKCKLGAKKAANSPTRGASLAATRRALGLSKLTDAQIQTIRSSDATNIALAAQFQVSHKAISDVRLGKTWCRVDNPFAGLGART